MKSNILFIKMLFLSCLVLTLGFTLGGCSDDDEEGLQAGYGYAQFKLFKSGAYNAGKTTSRAGINELEYLREAQKMKIILVNSADGTEVTQTVGLYAMGSDSELGLRSENLQLLAGSYTIVGFHLYKIVDQGLQPILSGEPAEHTVITVVNGGLAVQDIAIKVVERGNVKFTLTKNIISTRSRGDEPTADFLFSDVCYAKITVQNQFSKVLESFDDALIPFKYTEKIDQETKKVYAVAVSDSLLSLKAGTYKLVSYGLFSKDKKGLSAGGIEVGTTFEVKDNQASEVEAPVNLYESTDRIQDYLALYEIWKSLGGDKGKWSYSGETYPRGTNWNFNKDIDMWGDQPEVGLDAKGRVTILNLGSFGCEGDVPAALGQLTELTVLTLGTHSDEVGGNMLDQWRENMTPEEKEAIRNDYYNRFLKKDVRAALSEPLQIALEKQGQPIEKTADIRARMGASTRDASSGNLTNGIVGVPKEIGNLTKLRQLYIANGKFVDFAQGTDFSKLEDLTDVELYNCPSMKIFPKALLTLPNLEFLNMANNPQIASGDLEDGLDEFAKNGMSNKKLQILYMTNNSLTTLPESFKNLEKLGKLDCTNNQITTIPALGKKINLVQLTMDHNQITEIPADFCGFEDVETFSFSYNKLTKFPNIFDAKSVYVMSSIDFSYNEISEFEGGDDFKGLNVKTLTLSGNKFKTFPGILFKKNSTISILNLNGNGMEDFPDGSLTLSRETAQLETLDLTYNKLSKLPKEFNAITLPYLYGFDLSNNRFSSFPTSPLNIDHLSVFGLRNQRDENGNRIMREWPAGIEKCPSLFALFLAGNDLRKIEGTISPYIHIFEIKDNPNIILDVSAVCSLIKAGRYNLIYDTTQDIRGCDYLDLEK